MGNQITQALSYLALTFKFPTAFFLHSQQEKGPPSSSSSLGHVPVQFSSVTQSCPTLFDPMNRSTPGLPVHHQPPEFTQSHVYRVSDAIQPSHPLSSPSPHIPNPSQHQGLFQWVNSSHEVAKVLGFPASASVLPMNTQDWSPLGWTGWVSLQSKGLSESSPTQQFNIRLLFLLSELYD